MPRAACSATLSAAGLLTSTGGSPVFTATPVLTAPRSRALAACTWPLSISSEISAWLRMITSQGCPASRPSFIRPTAPKVPARSKWCSERKRSCSCVTSPWAAPPLRRCSTAEEDCGINTASIHRDVRGLDDAGPFGDVFAHVFVKGFRAHHHGRGALFAPQLLDLRLAGDFRHRFIEPVDDGLGCAARRHQAQ